MGRLARHAVHCRVPLTRYRVIPIAANSSTMALGEMYRDSVTNVEVPNLWSNGRRGRGRKRLERAEIGWRAAGSARAISLHSLRLQKMFIYNYPSAVYLSQVFDIEAGQSALRYRSLRPLSRWLSGYMLPTSVTQARTIAPSPFLSIHKEDSYTAVFSSPFKSQNPPLTLSIPRKREVTFMDAPPRRSYRALAPVGIQELNAAQVVHQGLLESHQHTREPLEKFLFCSISSLTNFAPPRSFFQGYWTIPAQTCPAKGRTENNTHIL